MNARRGGAVIELLGAPGAGKSGLADALAALDGVVVVKDHTRGDLPSLAWSMARSLPIVVAPPPDIDRRRWAAWAARVTAAGHVAAHRIGEGAKTVVFDQGPAYTLVRMLQMCSRQQGNEWWSQRCAETASLLDLVVLVDADPDVLAERVRGRDKIHAADQLADASLLTYLDTERRACHQVADALARDGAEVIRVITSDVPLEVEAETVLAALQKRDRREEFGGAIGQVG